MLLAVGCLASCGGAFGDAPGSSGSSSSDGGSGQTNGGTDSDGGSGTNGATHLDGGVVDPGTTFWFVDAQGPVQQVVQEQMAFIPIKITRYITPGTDIKIDIINPPEGISAVGSLTISSGQSTGTLAIAVGASSPDGRLRIMLSGAPLCTTSSGSRGGELLFDRSDFLFNSTVDRICVAS